MNGNEQVFQLWIENVDLSFLGGGRSRKAFRYATILGFPHCSDSERYFQTCLIFERSKKKTPLGLFVLSILKFATFWFNEIFIHFFLILYSDFQMRCPQGKKTKYYKRAKLEKFAHYLMKDGLVSKLSVYMDKECKLLLIGIICLLTCTYQ